MTQDWLLKLIKTSAELSEKEKYFEERTNAHIQRVQAAVKKIALAHAELADAVESALTHDASKLADPERAPYIEITWRHKTDRLNGYKTPGSLPNPSENEATVHHITNNRHHPESWVKNEDDVELDPNDRDSSKKCIDATRMDDISIAEMVADWQAMSEEFKKNTAREWYDKQKDVRWHFSPEQDAVIDKCLAVFENSKE